MIDDHQRHDHHLQCVHEQLADALADCFVRVASHRYCGQDPYGNDRDKVVTAGFASVANESD